jgi:serine/threonine protein kinase
LVADPDRETVQSTSDDPALAPTSRTSPPGEAYRPGDRLGARYRVTGFLGRGGMGAVYLAHDELLGAEVALKLVGDALTPDHLERLRGEVLLAQKVTHPAVCRTYDLEEVDHRWLIKMEYVDGESLASRLRAGPLPIAEVLRIAREIADGLASAHRRQVIHRDLKPHNVMLERGTKRVVLMDFGVARRIDADGALDEVAGTPGYMAPEQASRGRVDARTDVYALGCVIYQMLAGTLPFPASTVAQAANRAVKIPDPVAVRPDTPAWLAAAVVQMLDVDPARRPGDATAVLALLAGPPARRRLVWILGGVAATSAAAFAVVVATHEPSPPAVAPAPRAPWTPRVDDVGPPIEENVDGLAMSPDGARVAYSSSRDGGPMRLYVSKLGSTDSLFVSPPGREVVHASWARDGSIIGSVPSEQLASYRYRLDGTVERLGPANATVCGDGFVYRRPATDCPDCDALVSTGPDGERELARTAPFGRFVDAPACDSAGDHVAFSLSAMSMNVLRPACDLFVVRRAGGPARKLTNGGENRYPSFARRGATIVYSSAQDSASLHVWEVSSAGGSPVQRTTGAGNDFAPVVTPDDRTLAFNLDQTVMTAFAYRPGRNHERVLASQAQLSSLATARDGALLATRTTLAGDEVVEISPDITRALAPGREPVATAHGDAVVFAQLVGRTSRVLAIARTGGAPRELATVDGEVRELYVDDRAIVHLHVQRGSAGKAMHVPLAGGTPVVEGGPLDLLVQPSPTGWVLHVVAADTTVDNGPGGAASGSASGGPARLDPPGTTRAPVALGKHVDYAAWNAAGTVVAYVDGREVHRFDIATNRDELVAQITDAVGVAVSPDGKTVYTLEVEGHVRRMLVRNFGDRPPP